MNKPKPEKIVTKECIGYLRATGWTCIRIQQNIGSMKGIADYYILKDGFHAWLELKGEKGTQSNYQKQFELIIKANKGYYIIVNSIESLIQKLSEAVAYENEMRELRYNSGNRIRRPEDIEKQGVFNL